MTPSPQRDPRAENRDKEASLHAPLANIGEQIGHLSLRIGDRVGPYVVSEFIARGAFAIACKAYHAHAPRELRALKFGDLAGGGRYITRCLKVTSKRSAKALSPDETPAEAIFFRGRDFRSDFLSVDEIDHLLECEYHRLMPYRDREGIVKVDDSLLSHNGRHVVVTEFVQGRTLREIIRETKDPKKLDKEILLKVATILYESGLVHRDLKPENIIVKPNGEIKIIDPGLHDAQKALIATTPHYNPFLHRSSRADVMGIGVMLYEILSGGALPFEGIPFRGAGEYYPKEFEPSGEVERLRVSYFLSFPDIRELVEDVGEKPRQIIYKSLTVPEYTIGQLCEDLADWLNAA